MMSSRWSRSLYSAFTAVSLALLAAEPPLALAQRAHAAKAPLTFDVATVKAVDPHTITVIDARVYPDGHLIIHAHRLAMLIAEAFNIPEWELVGGDESVVQAWFDVEGKPPRELRDAVPEGEYSGWGIQDARVRSMLQSLLLERFHLRFHVETQPGTVYELKRGKDPLRLKAAEPKSIQPAADATVTPDRASTTGVEVITAGEPVGLWQTSMFQLARSLSNVQRTPVIDQTGLSGFYNFTSRTVVTNEDFQNGGQTRLLIDAVPEMGLKLVKAHGMVQKFVIDSVQQPEAN